MNLAVRLLICGFFLRGMLPNNAISILAYAARHGYPKICTEAAPLTLRLDPKEAFQHLGHPFFVNWVTQGQFSRRDMQY